MRFESRCTAIQSRSPANMIFGISTPTRLSLKHPASYRSKMQRSPVMKLELEAETSLYPFVLTEEQEHLRREIREFAAREIAPNVMAWDEACEFPMGVIKKLGAMGLLGVIFPPE